MQRVYVDDEDETGCTSEPTNGREKAIGYGLLFFLLYVEVEMKPQNKLEGAMCDDEIPSLSFLLLTNSVTAFSQLFFFFSLTRLFLEYFFFYLAAVGLCTTAHRCLESELKCRHGVSGLRRTNQIEKTRNAASHSL